jgi:hypothetical protein
MSTVTTSLILQFFFVVFTPFNSLEEKERIGRLNATCHKVAQCIVSFFHFVVGGAAVQ